MKRTRIDESMPIAFEDVTAARDAVWPTTPTTEDGTKFAETEDFILLMLAVRAAPHRTIHCWPAVTRERARFVKFNHLLAEGRI